MHYSGKVSQAMAAKGCLPQLKKIGFFNCTGHTSKISAYHSALIDAGFLVHGLFVCGTVNDTTIFFAGTEEEVLAKIAAVEVRDKKPVPESVIVKMLALRLKRIAEAIGQINHQVSVELEWRKTQSSQASLPTMLDELKFSDVGDGFKRIVQHNNLGYDRVKTVNEAVETFERDEVTPEAIRKAWELYSVNAVMSE